MNDEKINFTIKDLYGALETGHPDIFENPSPLDPKFESKNPDEKKLALWLMEKRLGYKKWAQKLVGEIGDKYPSEMAMRSDNTLFLYQIMSEFGMEYLTVYVKYLQGKMDEDMATDMAIDKIIQKE